MHSTCKVLMAANQMCQDWSSLLQKVLSLSKHPTIILNTLLLLRHNFAIRVCKGYSEVGHSPPIMNSCKAGCRILELV